MSAKRRFILPGFFGAILSREDNSSHKNKKHCTALQAIIASDSKEQAIQYLVERAGYSIHARDSVDASTLLHHSLYYLAEKLEHVAPIAPENNDNTSLIRQYTHAEKLLHNLRVECEGWEEAASEEAKAIQKELQDFKEKYYYPASHTYALPSTPESKKEPFLEIKQELNTLESKKSAIQKKINLTNVQHKQQLQMHQRYFEALQGKYYKELEFLKDLIEKYQLSWHVKNANGDTPLDILKRDIPIMLFEGKTILLNSYLRNPPAQFIEEYNLEKQKIATDMSLEDYGQYLLISHSDLMETISAIMEYAEQLSAKQQVKAESERTANFAQYDTDNTLHLVMQASNLSEAVKLLLHNGHDPNEQNLSGATVLHHLVTAGDDAVLIKILQYLIKTAKADVNLKDIKKNTPLHLAKGNVITAYLLEHDADFTQKNNQGYTPLEMACIQQDFEKMHCLLDHIDKIGLHSNVKANTLDLMVHKMDESFRKFSSQVNQSSKTSLQSILSYLLTDPLHPLSLTVLKFFTKVPSVDLHEFLDFGQELPLTQCLNTWIAEQSVIKRLLQSNVSGAHPLLLHYVLRYTNSNIPEWIKKAGIKISDSIQLIHNVDNSGNTALHFTSDAVSTGYLLDKGVKFVANDIGKTPLHYACARGNAEVVECLLQRHASLEFDINGIDQYGYSALDVNLQVTKLLQKALSIIKSKDSASFFKPRTLQIIGHQLHQLELQCNHIMELLRTHKACVVKYSPESFPTTFSENNSFEENTGLLDPFLVVEFNR